jgi:hypothetical protein
MRLDLLRLGRWLAQHHLEVLTPADFTRELAAQNCSGLDSTCAPRIVLFKDSTRGQWLETRDGLLKMLQEIPLSDEERVAVDGDVQALNRLLERLKGIPTPGECHAESRQKSLQTFIPVGEILSKS